MASDGFNGTKHQNGSVYITYGNGRDINHGGPEILEYFTDSLD